MKVIKQTEWYTVSACRNKPRTLFVFGDNLLGIGRGGQAQIRYLPNSFGIATKIKPTIEDDAFFSDKPEEFAYIDQTLYNLSCYLTCDKYDTIVFPADGLGTGLAMMPQKSPKLYQYMNEKIFEMFGILF